MGGREGEEAGTGSSSSYLTTFRASARCASFTPNWNSRPAPFLLETTQVAKPTSWLTYYPNPPEPRNEQSATADIVTLPTLSKVKDKDKDRAIAIAIVKDLFQSQLSLSVLWSQFVGAVNLVVAFQTPYCSLHSHPTNHGHCVLTSQQRLLRQDSRFQQCPKCLGSRCRQKSLLHDEMRKASRTK